MIACPHCGSGDFHRTLETRPSPYGIRRRHRCRACKLTFASYNGKFAVRSGLGRTAVAAAIAVFELSNR